MNKPIIGIVGRTGINEDHSVIMVSDEVRRSVINFGGIPILILPTQDVDYNVNSKEPLTDKNKEDLKKIIDYCDGIIMPGAYALYEYDRFIYEYAKGKDMPILGICGGMQLMAINDKAKPEDNVLSLIQSDINHRSPGVDRVHKIKINKGTLLYDIIKKEETSVNSRHRYCVNGVNSLKISAISEDGIIESIEDSNGKFILGVQWHPENMYEFDEDMANIFKRFIDSCR